MKKLRKFLLFVFFVIIMAVARMGLSTAFDWIGNVFTGASATPAPRTAINLVTRATVKPSKQTAGKTTKKPTAKPTKKPTAKPTKKATAKATKKPTAKPTKKPTPKPTKKPTKAPALPYAPGTHSF